MKMFRLVMVSNKSYRGKRNTLYRAMVLASDKDDAIAKVEATMGCALTDRYEDCHIIVSEIEQSVYTY